MGDASGIATFPFRRPSVESVAPKIVARTPPYPIAVPVEAEIVRSGDLGMVRAILARRNGDLAPADECQR